MKLQFTSNTSNKVKYVYYLRRSVTSPGRFDFFQRFSTDEPCFYDHPLDQTRHCCENVGSRIYRPSFGHTCLLDCAAGSVIESLRKNAAPTNTPTPYWTVPKSPPPAITPVLNDSRNSVVVFVRYFSHGYGSGCFLCRGGCHAWRGQRPRGRLPFRGIDCGGGQVGGFLVRVGFVVMCSPLPPDAACDDPTPINRSSFDNNKNNVVPNEGRM